MEIFIKSVVGHGSNISCKKMSYLEIYSKSGGGGHGPPGPPSPRSMYHMIVRIVAAIFCDRDVGDDRMETRLYNYV